MICEDFISSKLLENHRSNERFHHTSYEEWVFTELGATGKIVDKPRCNF